jgi:predicted metal-dependent hydrolase
MRHSIQYGDERIAFTVRYLPRPLQRVAISVLPDGGVRVDAPALTDPDEVVAAVRHRARWIWRQLEAQRERMLHVLPREYVSGECHFYLGRRYILKVIATGGAEPGVKLLRGRLEVTTRDRDPRTVRRLLEAWYRQRAEQVFSRHIAGHTAELAWLSTPPALRLMNMRTQWGSCSPRGELLLNPQLVKAPRACVDYVVAHELCHLKEHNHSARFYRLLAALMPDWEARKQALDDMAEQLLNR